MSKFALPLVEAAAMRDWSTEAWAATTASVELTTSIGSHAIAIPAE
jgi:hypothetical protein